LGQTFKQTAKAETPIGACSGLTLASYAVGRLAEVDGTAGGASDDIELTIPGSTTGIGLVFVGEPKVRTWATGTWKVRLNVPTGGENGFISWKALYVCRVSGTDIETMVSDAAVNTLLNSSGTFTETLSTTGSATSESYTSHLYWVYVFQNASGSEQTLTVRPSKNLLTPLADAEAPPVPGTHRRHIAVNRCAASSVANSEFARSMLESCGSQAWHFGYSMEEQYHAHSMNVTAQSIAASAARRAGLSNASVVGLNVGAASMVREILSAGSAVAGSAGGALAQRSHISSGARTA